MKRLFLILLLFSATNVFSQVKELRKADRAFRKENYDDAIDFYQEALLDYDYLSLKDKARIYYLIAECYRMLNKAEYEVTWYDRAIKSNYVDSMAARKYSDTAKQQLAAKDSVLPFWPEYADVKIYEKPKMDSSMLSYANKAFRKGEYLIAIYFYKKGYTNLVDGFDNQTAVIKSAKATILFKIAECYRMLNDSKQEVQWYKKSIKAKCADTIAARKYLDTAQKQLGEQSDK
jgi:hypothetical protein